MDLMVFGHRVEKPNQEQEPLICIKNHNPLKNNSIHEPLVQIVKLKYQQNRLNDVFDHNQHKKSYLSLLPL